MNTPAHSAFSLNGKTILVTGASSGLGRQIAIACAQRGARIVLAGRDKDRLAQTQAQLQGTGHVSVLGDLTG
ncbi:SDR family NAD(P)-dependent oxidoreductase, partial [Xanthomonas citri]